MKTKSVKPFKLNGKPFDFTVPTPAFDKLLRVLDKLPDNEYLDRSELAAKAGVGKCLINDSAKNKVKMFPYRILMPHPRGYIFGNPRSIRQLARHLSSLEGA